MGVDEAMETRVNEQIPASAYAHRVSRWCRRFSLSPRNRVRQLLPTIDDITGRPSLSLILLYIWHNLRPYPGPYLSAI